MSDLRVTNLKGRNAGEAPTLPDGVVITGIATVSSVVVSAGTTALPSISPTGDTNTGIFFPAADTVAISEGGVEAMRVDSSGRLLIGISTSGNANGGVLQLSSGITFPATAVAASDANTLDDYEEGTWTPNITSSGGGSGSGTDKAGHYVKVGRIVHVTGNHVLTNKTGINTGSVRIEGLPFTSSATAGQHPGVSFSTINSLVQTGIFTVGGVDPNTNYIVVNNIISNATQTAITVSELTSVTGFYFSAVYSV